MGGVETRREETKYDTDVRAGSSDDPTPAPNKSTNSHDDDEKVT